MTQEQHSLLWEMEHASELPPERREELRQIGQQVVNRFTLELEQETARMVNALIIVGREKERRAARRTKWQVRWRRLKFWQKGSK